MTNVIMTNVIMTNVIMTNVIMPSVIRPNVIIQNVVAPLRPRLRPSVSSLGPKRVNFVLIRLTQLMLHFLGAAVAYNLMQLVRLNWQLKKYFTPVNYDRRKTSLLGTLNRCVL
jgi:hypothetical protein